MYQDKKILFLFTLITITICPLFTYTALGNLSNNSSVKPKVISNTTNSTIENTIMTTKIGLPSISISTDKIRYILSEIVQVSGKVYDEEGNSNHERITLQVTLLPNSSKVPPHPEYLYWIYNIMAE
ncbi:MAG TPA: hypothetical protein VE244_15165 [Nitrososphaeraceae archaeon]|nr:hypothetical protein [Nitrososphaeraceae archaeon]